jgi:hypothetical protein
MRLGRDPQTAVAGDAGPWHRRSWPQGLRSSGRRGSATHPRSTRLRLETPTLSRRAPTWDGRGVTIALLDGNPDLLLPEFQTAYALDGTPVPKIADFLNVTDPRDDADLNPQWVDMGATVTSSDRTVTLEGKTFTVPKDGDYRIGLFSERRFNMDSNASYIDQDIDRNGNPKGDDGMFGVLWDEDANDVGRHDRDPASPTRRR